MQSSVFSVQGLDSALLLTSAQAKEFGWSGTTFSAEGESEVAVRSFLTQTAVLRNLERVLRTCWSAMDTALTSALMAVMAEQTALSSALVKAGGWASRTTVL